VTEPRRGSNRLQLRIAGVPIRRRRPVEDRARPGRHPPARALAASRQVRILVVRRLGKFFITSAQSTSYVLVIVTDRLRRGSVFRVNMDCLAGACVAQGSPHQEGVRARPCVASAAWNAGGGGARGGSAFCANSCGHA
jgi:hypothetical protein